MEAYETDGGDSIVPSTWSVIFFRTTKGNGIPSVFAVLIKSSTAVVGNFEARNCVVREANARISISHFLAPTTIVAVLVDGDTPVRRIVEYSVQNIV